MNKRIENNSIIKKYCKKSLLSSDSVITDRINQINRFDYKNYPSLTFTEILEKGDVIVYRQQFVKRQQLTFHKGKAGRLAEALDYFSSIDFIHGDINRKNIVSTQADYKVIDYEPDLFQLRRGKPCQLVTLPYVSELDRTHQTISTLTDKIGFAYFLLRSTGRITSSMVYSLYSSASRDHSLHIGISEDELTEMSYSEILTSIVGS